MPAAPVGSEVSLYYDTRDVIEPGDALQTGTGRVYLILRVRKQTRGKHAGHRHHLRAMVVEPPVPEGVTVWPLVWYHRGAKVRA